MEYLRIKTPGGSNENNLKDQHYLPKYTIS
jgi:hypothetical protein